MDIVRIHSYTAADDFPVKLLKHRRLNEFIASDKRVLPIHVQFIPTNNCNMACSFCSCSKENRGVSMALHDVYGIIKDLKSLGTEAVTITGGGEPLVHPDIDDIIYAFYDAGIEIGLVTNGTLVDKISNFKFVTWCRVSHGDERIFASTKQKLEKAISGAPTVDWAFSYVASDKPNFAEMQEIVRFANKHNFTHVRIVADLMMPDKVPMNRIKSVLGAITDDRIVIYQPRNNPVSGSDCYICYLKPLISADLKVYTCCGAQYALEKPSNRLPDELCLGSASSLRQIIGHSNKPFDGSICYRCYYSSYNRVIESMLSEVEHNSFL